MNISHETAEILIKIGRGLGVAAMGYAIIAGSLEKRRRGKISTEPSLWMQSFGQATARYLTNAQKGVFFGAMGCAIALIVVGAVCTR